MLHGLGQTPDSWDATVEQMEADTCCPDLFSLLQGAPVTYGNLYDAFSQFCGEFPAPIQLCGLSLGGILALQYAIEHPERVSSLALIGAQFTMPKGLLRLQNAVFRCMPARAFAAMGLAKAELLTLTASMLEIDLQKGLQTVAAPTLVLCGARDTANKKAALALQAQLPHATLSLVDGAGHEVNIDAPQALGALLNTFFHSS